MIVGIQIVGVLFALIMMYLTFLYYKRNSYSGRSFTLWILIWAGFIIVTFFPQTLYGIMEGLSIHRTVDLLIIAGFMLFAVIIFYLYATIKSLEKKIETVVRRTAVSNPLLPRKHLSVGKKRSLKESSKGV